MDDKVTSQAESDEKILTFDMHDEALEQAGWAYCTNAYYWYDCSWPQ